MRVLSRESARSGPWVDSLDEAFRRSPHLEPRDRAFVSNLVSGVWRWRGRLDWLIGRVSTRPLKDISPVVLNILRLALYQIEFMDRVPDSAAVNEAVKQVKSTGASRAAPFVNGLLRNLCRDRSRIRFPDPAGEPVKSLAASLSYPEWLVARWVAAFGLEETRALLQAQNRVPDLVVRANRMKTDPGDLAARLAKEGVQAEPLKAFPDGVRILDLRGRVDRLEAFREGLFQVQDPGAQTAAHLLSPQPGERILDLCAGLGGKTTHLAELTGGLARVTALDIRPDRLIHLRRAAARLGLSGIDPVAGDGLRGLGRLFKGAFDAVLIDAPCSGLGVLGRHPDGKWNRTEADITRLASVQKALLHEAAEVLRPGGRMLFVTCTIAPEENEEVVQGFLEERSDLELADLRDRAPEWARAFIDAEGFYRALPHLHDIDGFFGALLVRSGGDDLP